VEAPGIELPLSGGRSRLPDRGMRGIASSPGSRAMSAPDREGLKKAVASCSGWKPRFWGNARTAASSSSPPTPKPAPAPSPPSGAKTLEDAIAEARAQTEKTHGPLRDERPLFESKSSE
jgi:hypothetical protein